MSAQGKIRNMEEFAAVVGISRPTVSKYFNDPSSVRPRTRARIEDALERHDWRPNLYAVNQNRRMTKTVGIVVPYLADPFFAELARRLEQSCVAAGFRPIILSPYGRRAAEAEILDNLRGLRPAGVLLAPLGRASDRGAIERFCAEVPTILVDSNLEGLGQAFVGSDNFSFVSQTVEYLSRVGEPPALFEMRDPANPNANKRRAAYLHMMDRFGFEPMMLSVEGAGWEFEEIGKRGALDLLARDALPSRSILCSNDRLAIGFLAACYVHGVEVGKRPGSTLLLASNDDHPFARFTHPPLTTAAHDYEAVVARAIALLGEMVEGGGRLPGRTEDLFPARLVMRDSA